MKNYLKNLTGKNFLNQDIPRQSKNGTIGFDFKRIISVTMKTLEMDLIIPREDRVIMEIDKEDFSKVREEFIWHHHKFIIPREQLLYHKNRDWELVERFRQAMGEMYQSVKRPITFMAPKFFEELEDKFDEVIPIGNLYPHPKLKNIGYSFRFCFKISGVLGNPEFYTSALIHKDCVL